MVRLKDERTGAVVPGYGSWPKDVEAYGTDKGNSKFSMAAIRAERQAWSRIRPGEIPGEGEIEVGDEAYASPQAAIEMPVTAEIITSEGEHVDASTGEVLAELPAPEAPKTQPKEASARTEDQLSALKKLCAETGRDWTKFVEAVAEKCGGTEDWTASQCDKWIASLERAKGIKPTN